MKNEMGESGRFYLSAFTDGNGYLVFYMAGISNWRNKSGIFLCDDVMGISGCNCSSDGSMGGTYNCGFKGLGGVM